MTIKEMTQPYCYQTLQLLKEVTAYIYTYVKCHVCILYNSALKGGLCFLDNYIILISGISTLLKIVASVLLTIFAISIAGNIASVSEIFMEPQTQLVNDGILNGSTSISTPILVTTLSLKPSKYS